MREALNRGVCVGLGTDIAGGYSIDIMGAMRWAVGVARMSEGARLERSRGQARGSCDQVVKPVIETGGVSVDWKEALYMGTRGGAVALGLGSGVFKIGAPFDAQQSRDLLLPCCLVYAHFPLILVCLFNPSTTPEDAGPLDFFDLDHESLDLSPEMIEKWWCLGGTRNRTGMWVQGRRIFFG